MKDNKYSDEGWDGWCDSEAKPTRTDVVLFWTAIVLSVTVTSIGAMELMRVMGWIQ